MTDGPDEQSRVIAAPLHPMSVVACAGSGKTYTAVRRLAHMRRLLGESRGRVALLSFSNVAVDTFRHEYQQLIQGAPDRAACARVEIDTLDGFITTNILRTHAGTTMGSQRTPFLVTGGETFLQGFKIQTDTYPRDITGLNVGVYADEFQFSYAERDTIRAVDAKYATTLVSRLGRTGAYTHNLGRYWCYRTLLERRDILRVLVRRYPHVLIDEAQDIGNLHQALVELLISAGCRVSLIGDPNQGIYDFAGANGDFLREYAKRDGVVSYGLTRNFRSVAAILGLANALSKRTDTAVRESPDTAHGTYYVAYRDADRDLLVDRFRTALLAAGLKVERSAVLCRGRELADRLARNEDAPGQGIVKVLAGAAILRDRDQNYLASFRLVASAFAGLLADAPRDLVARITRHPHTADERSLRRVIWAFARNIETGLPSASLKGQTEWHPRMRERLVALLASVKQSHGLASASNIGNKLARTGLSDAPLFSGVNASTRPGSPTVRIDTVHQVKGESLDAVLYFANREQASALLEGVGSEVGRIGYVAVTRARDLVWLGVPHNAVQDLELRLSACGFLPLPGETVQGEKTGAGPTRVRRRRKDAAPTKPTGTTGGQRKP